jgi:exopolysaccharide biosynthesis polyprenyl glycosylphosphotransferase
VKAEDQPFIERTPVASTQPPVMAASFPWSLEAARRSHGGSIPRRFLLIADTAGIFLSFATAQVIAPWLQGLVAPGGALRARWLEFLRPPAAEDIGYLPSLLDALWIPLVVVPVAVLAMQALGGYRPVHQQSRSRVLLGSVCSPLFGASSLALVLFAFKQHHVSRLLVFSFTLLSIVALGAYRLGIRTYRLRRERAGLYAHNVVVVGRVPAVRQLTSHFQKHVHPYAYRLAGYLELPDDESVPPDHVARLGRVEDLGDLLIHRPVHDVLVVQGSGDTGWLPKVMERCDYFHITLRIVPEALMTAAAPKLDLVFRSTALSLPEVVVHPASLDSEALFVKRVADVVLSAAALVLLSPVLLLTALAIKLTTPHLPVFYPWRVIGYKGNPFTGYKFTTMVEDADDRKQSLMHLNEMTGPVFKIKNDPRVTRLGRLLRKYSLNELPQLWSVLRGDMSLVGPRPAGPHELERYELWHKRKLSVQPGITCLWQVRGRNDISDFDDWVRMDLEYIDQWSLWLDFKILVRTALAVLKGTGS